MKVVSLYCQVFLTTSILLSNVVIANQPISASDQGVSTETQLENTTDLKENHSEVVEKIIEDTLKKNQQATMEETPTEPESEAIIATADPEISLGTETAVIPPETESNAVDPSQIQNVNTSKNSVERLGIDIESVLSHRDPRVELRFEQQLSDLYKAYPFAIWQKDTDVNAFKTQLVLMALSGLDKQYTHWLELLKLDNLESSQKELIMSDALIGYLHYVNDVSKHKETWLYKPGAYKVQPAYPKNMASLVARLNEGMFSAFIQELEPDNKNFRTLSDYIISHSKENFDQWPIITATKSLKPNQQSPDIDKIEYILSYYGMLAPIKAVASQVSENNTQEVVTSNVYDDRLVEGVKNFQKSLGLTADGVIGPQTRQWLNTPPEQRLAILALNAQRLRVIPNDVETGIMVNIPDYSLKFYKEGELVLDSRVIVGSVARKTPIMSNQINRVVINPPWSVPTKLAREDIAPKGIKDPHYFVRNGYSLVELDNGQPIDVDAVRWENVDANNFPFAVRQKPGSGNSLGRYKFDMPNDQAIYLHDTPNHSLFERDVRAISSGCVRVNKATELANILLNLENWNNEKVAKTVEKGQTTPVNLASKVPVELYYLTAWANEKGEIQFRADIYGYDKMAENVKISTHSFDNLL